MERIDRMAPALGPRVVVDAEGEVLAVNEHGKRLEKAVTAALPRR